MKITAVRYGKLISGPNFTNTRVELEAQVTDDEDPISVLSDLRRLVHEQLKDPVYERVERAKRILNGLEDNGCRW